MASNLFTAYREKILEDFLSCSICHQPYTKPKALPCQHSFCQECLDKQQRISSTGLILKCSLCRDPAILPTEGVEGFPDNRLVAQLCKEFCSTSPTLPDSHDSRCGFHPTKDVDLFCQQCEVPVCSECIGDAHLWHNITGVKQAAPQITSNIKAQLDTGRQNMQVFSTLLQETEHLQTRLMDNTTQVQQEINKAFEAKLQTLQDQKDRLLATVERNHQDNMAALAGQRDHALTQLAELSKVCEDAEELVKQEKVVLLSQDLNLAQKLAKIKTPQAPDMCETKRCTFEPRMSSYLLELGKVTLQNMSDKQLTLQSREPVVQPLRKDTDTCTNNQPDISIRVGQPWVKTASFGGKGLGIRELKYPRGVAVSQDNTVYIADCENSRIQVVTMDGVYVKEFSTILPDENGKKIKPNDIAVDRNNNLWVVAEDCVVQYSREGTSLVKQNLPNIEYCRGIAVTMETDMVIVLYDGKIGLLRVFNQDGSQVAWHDSGHTSQKSWRPQYVTVDGEGNILVTDSNNHSVDVLDRDGNFKFKFGREESDEHQLKTPRGICVDVMGNIIVVDGDGSVKKFDSQGRFLSHIGTGLIYPLGVTVSPSGHVVVTDVGDDTVSVWTQG